MATHEEDTNDPGLGYKVAEKVPMEKLLSQDADDPSLQAYKKSLGLTGEVYAPANDPRRVVILEMRVVCEDRPDGNIVYEFADDAAVKAMKDKPFILKEGCKYIIKITFRVQHEIVVGLKYVNQVYRKGVRVAKEEEMIGSFGPQKQPHQVTIPRTGWEEAPSGMLSRGAYTAKSAFVDDDKQTHLEYEYSFAIKKGWTGD
jgi:Rho GDP-dissociation inhibitor